jgi:hydroxymethylpyrimidine/phosphomethylpyrimidine kinase
VTYTIAALLVSDPVVTIVRRELRKLADGLNPNIEDVRAIIGDHIIKRELTDAEEAKFAAKAVKKMQHHAKAGRAIQSRDGSPAADGEVEEKSMG